MFGRLIAKDWKKRLKDEKQLLFSQRIRLFLFFTIVHSTLVGQRPMKSISFVCPSVHQSIRPSVTSFFKIVSLVFSDTVHDDR